MPRFEREYLKVVDQMKQDKLQWLQDPSEVKEDNLSDVRRVDSRHIKNKKRQYLKDKINETEIKSKNRNITDIYRGITKFKDDY
jgi:hypothetical protein